MTIEYNDEPLLRLIGKQSIFAISELNSSAMAWSIDTILFAICSIYFLLRSRRVSLRSSDSFNGDLRNKSFYILSTSSLHILVISSSIPSILSLSCLRISILRFNTFPGASRAILTFLFRYLLYFTWWLPPLSLGFCKFRYSFHSLTTPLSFIPHHPPSSSFALQLSTAPRAPACLRASRARLPPRPPTVSSTMSSGPVLTAFSN